MSDQASRLRSLVNQTSERKHDANEDLPPVLIMIGGKSGVGATTICVNTAVALGLQGVRVVLVDAGLYRVDVATMCGIEHRTSQSNTHDIHELLQRGPGGIQVVPGFWSPADPTRNRPFDCIKQQLQSLSSHADLVMIDMGSGVGVPLRHFCPFAQDLVVVTTTDDVAIMDSYATIKTIRHRLDTVEVRLIVNQASDEASARDVHNRIDRSCRRFLGLGVDFLGWLPRNTAHMVAPIVCDEPGSPFSKHLIQLTKALTSHRQLGDPKLRAA